MTKLHGASKAYFDKKYGVAEPISSEMQQSLEESGRAANDNIRRNNMIYFQSNANSHEYIVNENNSFGIPNNMLEESASLNSPIRALTKKEE